jgi:hypothetical protein
MAYQDDVRANPWYDATRAVRVLSLTKRDLAFVLEFKLIQTHSDFSDFDSPCGRTVSVKSSGVGGRVLHRYGLPVAD